MSLVSFLREIARAARSRRNEEVLAVAEEAMPLDNEALAIAEGPGAREGSAQYRKPKRKKR